MPNITRYTLLLQEALVTSLIGVSAVSDRLKLQQLPCARHIDNALHRAARRMIAATSPDDPE